jgi:hypothetical protein
MKITKHKLEVFHQYRGDPDAFAHTASVEERDQMAGFDWQRIDAIIQALRIVGRGAASSAFEEGALREAREVCVDDQVFKELTLRELALK